MTLLCGVGKNQQNKFGAPLNQILDLPLIVPHVIIVITIRCRQKTKSNLTRTKTFDAFVCYAFDADKEFVMNSIQSELEKQPDLSFKLCTHSRDFDIGLNIFDNIQEAIENSNIAITVISQGFILVIGVKRNLHIATLNT